MNVAAERAERLLWLATVALSLLPIWGAGYPPLLDFPEHALITHVVARGHYDAGADYHGRLVLRSLWAPYSFLYLLAVPLAHFMPATAAVKLLLSAALAGTALALRWLLRTCVRDPFAFYFGFPFLFSTAYLAGMIPYLLGIPVALLQAAWLLKQPRTTRRNFLPRLALQFVLLWAHPVLYAAMTAALASMLWRDVRSAGFRQAAGAALVWLAAPGLYLAAWAPSLHISGELSWQFKALHLKGFFFNIGAYELRAFDQAFLLPKAPLLAWVLLALALAWRERRRDRNAEDGDPRVATAAVVLLALALALPEYAAGRMVSAAFRLTPVALLLAAALLPARFTRPWPARLLLVSWCLAVLIAGAVLAWRFDRAMDGFVSLAQRMEPRQPAMLLFEGPENALFTHAIAYYHMEKGGISPQTFLAAPGVRQFPAELTPPFPWKQGYWEGTAADPLSDPDGRVFRYVVAKTSRSEAEPLPAFVPPNHRLVARAGGWLLFERVR